MAVPVRLLPLLQFRDQLFDAWVEGWHIGAVEEHCREELEDAAEVLGESGGWEGAERGSDDIAHAVVEVGREDLFDEVVGEGWMGGDAFADVWGASEEVE